MSRNAAVRKKEDLIKDLATIHQYRTQEKRMTWREISHEISKANSYYISEEALRVQYNRFKAKALQKIEDDIRETHLAEIAETKAELWNAWEMSLRGKKTVRQKFKISKSGDETIRELVEENIIEEKGHGDIQYINAYLKACDQEAKLVGLYTEDESGDGAEVAEWVEIVYPTKEEAEQIKAEYEAKQNPNE